MEFCGSGVILWNVILETRNVYEHEMFMNTWGKVLLVIRKKKWLPF